MDKRTELQELLTNYIPNVYFRPPSNLTMKYPCIVYRKVQKLKRFSNDSMYSGRQEWELTVIHTSPTNTVADEIESGFDYCAIKQYFTVNSLHHATLSLYF